MVLLLSACYQNIFGGGIITKKKLALVLALVMALALPAEAFAAYADTAGYWAEAAIDRWSSGSKPVLQGDLTGAEPMFMPTQGMQVVQLEIVIERMFGVQRPVYSASPEVTRDLAAKMLAEAFGIEPRAGIIPAEQFADHALIAADCVGYVYAMKDAGLMGGMGANLFNPNLPLTRAEVVTIIDEHISALIDTTADATLATYPESVVVRQSGVTLSKKTIHGDLIIGHGVGDGDVIIEDTVINGRLVVYGGGENSIIFRNSKANGVVGSKKEGQKANVKIEGESDVNNVKVKKDGRIIITGDVPSIAIEPGADVTIAGNAHVGEILMSGEGAKVDIQGTASVDKVTVVNTPLTAPADPSAPVVTPPASTLTVSGNGSVGAVVVEAPNTTVEATGNGKITEVDVEASGTTVGGSGGVDKVVVGEGVEGETVVTTPGTSVENNSGSDVVGKDGDVVAEPEETATTPGSQPSETTPSGGGSSGGGGYKGGGNDDDDDTVTINSVRATLDAWPAVGVTPDTEITTGNSSYNGEITWEVAENYSTTADNKWVGFTGAFEAGNTYRATVELTTRNSGYEFARTVAASFSVGDDSRPADATSRTSSRSLTFTGLFSVPAAPADVDKRDLEAAAAAAEDRLFAVKNGEENAKVGDEWADSEVWTTYETAITAAQLLLERTDLTQAQVDKAVADLAAATEAFEAAVKKKTGTGRWAELEAAIVVAEARWKEVKNGEDKAAVGEEWAATEDWTAYEDAITAAQQVCYADPASTPAQIAAAIEALADATVEFEAAVKTKTDTPAVPTVNIGVGSGVDIPVDDWFEFVFSEPVFKLSGTDYVTVDEADLAAMFSVTTTDTDASITAKFEKYNPETDGFDTDASKQHVMLRFGNFNYDTEYTVALLADKLYNEEGVAFVHGDEPTDFIVEGTGIVAGWKFTTKAEPTQPTTDAALYKLITDEFPTTNADNMGDGNIITGNALGMEFDSLGMGNFSGATEVKKLYFFNRANETDVYYNLGNMGANTEVELVLPASGEWSVKEGATDNKIILDADGANVVLKATSEQEGNAELTYKLNFIPNASVVVKFDASAANVGTITIAETTHGGQADVVSYSTSAQGYNVYLGTNKLTVPSGYVVTITKKGAAATTFEGDGNAKDVTLESAQYEFVVSAKTGSDTPLDLAKKAVDELGTLNVTIEWLLQSLQMEKAAAAEVQKQVEAVLASGSYTGVAVEIVQLKDGTTFPGNVPVTGTTENLALTFTVTLTDGSATATSDVDASVKVNPRTPVKIDTATALKNMWAAIDSEQNVDGKYKVSGTGAKVLGEEVESFGVVDGSAAAAVYYGGFATFNTDKQVTLYYNYDGMGDDTDITVVAPTGWKVTEVDDVADNTGAISLGGSKIQTVTFTTDTNLVQGDAIDFTVSFEPDAWLTFKYVGYDTTGTPPDTLPTLKLNDGATGGTTADELVTGDGLYYVSLYGGTGTGNKVTLEVPEGTTVSYETGTADAIEFDGDNSAKELTLSSAAYTFTVTKTPAPAVPISEDDALQLIWDELWDEFDVSGDTVYSLTPNAPHVFPTSTTPELFGVTAAMLGTTASSGDATVYIGGTNTDKMMTFYYNLGALGEGTHTVAVTAPDGWEVKEDSDTTTANGTVTLNQSAIQKVTLTTEDGLVDGTKPEFVISFEPDAWITFNFDNVVESGTEVSDAFRLTGSDTNFSDVKKNGSYYVSIVSGGVAGNSMSLSIPTGYVVTSVKAGTTEEKIVDSGVAANYDSANYTFTVYYSADKALEQITSQLVTSAADSDFGYGEDFVVYNLDEITGKELFGLAPGATGMGDFARETAVPAIYGWNGTETEKQSDIYYVLGNMLDEGEAEAELELTLPAGWSIKTIDGAVYAEETNDKIVLDANSDVLGTKVVIQGAQASGTPLEYTLNFRPNASIVFGTSSGFDADSSNLVETDGDVSFIEGLTMDDASDASDDPDKIEYGEAFGKGYNVTIGGNTLYVPESLVVTYLKVGSSDTSGTVVLVGENGGDGNAVGQPMTLESAQYDFTVYTEAEYFGKWAEDVKLGVATSTESYAPPMTVTATADRADFSYTVQADTRDYSNSFWMTDPGKVTDMRDVFGGGLFTSENHTEGVIEIGDAGNTTNCYFEVLGFNMKAVLEQLIAEGKLEVGDAVTVVQTNESLKNEAIWGDDDSIDTNSGTKTSNNGTDYIAKMIADEKPYYLFIGSINNPDIKIYKGDNTTELLYTVSFSLAQEAPVEGAPDPVPEP